MTEASASKSSADGCRNLNQEFMEIPEPFRVFLRIRKLTAEERRNDSLVPYVINGNKLLFIPASNTTAPGHDFTFSKIMDFETNQATVFDATTLATVQNFVAGQSSIIFSYGVTNSGKTFTMLGTSADPGVIPRALDIVFQTLSGRATSNAFRFKPQNGGIVRLTSREMENERKIKKDLFRMSKDPGDTCSILMESLNASNWKNSTCSSIAHSDSSRTSVSSMRSSFDLIDYDVEYSLWISFIEIYNEKIYDLLSPLKAIGHQLNRPDLKMQENREGHLFVKGVREICVDTVDEAVRLLIAGQQNLQVASTKLNYASSRSHSIYTIKLVRVVGEDSSDAHVSQLCFCDLAGSERYSKTQNVGHRLKEAGIINSSLLVLGRCISALRHNQLNTNDAPLPIPFRDSKLTRIFQGFFTGKGKASMIVSVNPGENSASETMHVLRFSALAKKIVLPQKLEFLDNPTKVTRLSLDFLRDTLDGRLSIPWEASKASLSSVAASGRLDYYAQPCSNDLPEQEEMDDEESDDDDESEEDNRDKDLKLKKYFDVIQILREKVLAENLEKMEIEMKTREQLSHDYLLLLEEKQKLFNERLEEERDEAQGKLGRLLRNLEEYYLKQLKYKQDKLDARPLVEDFDALKLKVQSLETTLCHAQAEKENMAVEYERKLEELELYSQDKDARPRIEDFDALKLKVQSLETTLCHAQAEKENMAVEYERKLEELELYSQDKDARPRIEDFDALKLKVQSLETTLCQAQAEKGNMAVEYERKLEELELYSQDKDARPRIEDFDALKLKVQSLETTLCHAQAEKENMAVEYERKLEELELYSQDKDARPRIEDFDALKLKVQSLETTLCLAQAEKGNMAVEYERKLEELELYSQDKDARPRIEDFDALKLKVQSLETTLCQVQAEKENMAVDCKRKLDDLVKLQIVELKRKEAELEALRLEHENTAHETLYETVMTHGSSSEGGSAVEQANRKWNHLYKVMTDSSDKSPDTASEEAFYAVSAMPRRVSNARPQSLTVVSSDDAIISIVATSPDMDHLGLKDFVEESLLEEGIAVIDQVVMTPTDLSKPNATMRDETEEDVTEVFLTPALSKTYAKICDAIREQPSDDLADIAVTASLSKANTAICLPDETHQKPTSECVPETPEPSFYNDENVATSEFLEMPKLRRKTKVRTKAARNFSAKKTAAARAKQEYSSDSSLSSLDTVSASKSERGKKKEVKRTGTQRLVNTKHLVECSPQSSPEKNLSAQNLVRRVLRPRK